VVECPGSHAPLLKALRERYRLACLELRLLAHCLAILEREGIADLFETIVISDEVRLAQAQAGHLETALRPDEGPAPPEALFVGDRADIDVIGARAAGSRPPGINREASAPHGHPAARLTRSAPRGLRAILRIP